MATNPRIQQAMMQDPRMAMAMQNQQMGTSTAPVASPLAGIARALQGGLGGMQHARLTKEYEGRDQDQRKAMLNAMFPNEPQAGVAGPMPRDPQRARLAKAMEAGLIGPQDLSKVMVSQMTPSEYGYETVNGTLLRTDPRRGTAEPVYEGGTKPTSGMKEYDFAKSQGYEGSFEQYQRDMKKAGASNVTVGGKYGTIPQGFMLQEDEKGARLVPLPGSPAAQEAEAAREAEIEKTRSDQQTANIVTQDIDRALGIIDSSEGTTTGFVGDWLSNIGGTKARDLRGLLDTVKANAGFAELQAMRDASPTGGALGQVSEREIAFLQSTIGNLEQSQSPEQLRQNLNRVWNAYQEVIHGAGNFERREMGGASSQAEDSDLESLLEKYDE